MDTRGHEIGGDVAGLDSQGDRGQVDDRLIDVSISVNNALTPHTPHPFRHGFITGGYHLVGVVGVTLVLAAWSG